MPPSNGAVDWPFNWVEQALNITLSNERIEYEADFAASIEPVRIEHTAISQPETVSAQIQSPLGDAFGFEAQYPRDSVFICPNQAGRDQKAGKVQKFWLGAPAAVHRSDRVPDPLGKLAVVFERSGPRLCERGAALSIVTQMTHGVFVW